jgi:hypothetical protein
MTCPLVIAIGELYSGCRSTDLKMQFHGKIVMRTGLRISPEPDIS